MNQFILALCGLPASGKSTLADAIQEALNFEVEIVRTDQWRDDDYYTNWKPEKEGPVRKAALDRVKELVVQGKSVIHDDTNYYTSMRHELFEIALQNNCGFSIVHVVTPVTVALQWNRERTGTKIPDKVIEDIFERFDNPGSRYLWDSADLEAAMEKQDLSSIVEEVIEILDELELVQKPKPRLTVSTENDRLDTETRRIVSQFLQEHPELRGHWKVSNIRRKFLGKADKKKIPIRDVRELLWSELSKLL